MYRDAGLNLTYRGVPPRVGAGWAVTKKQGYIKLSEAEEPVDTHWTVTVVGAD